MKIYVFEDLLILNVLFKKYIANITFKQFTKCCFIFGCTILFKKWAKTEYNKKAEEKQSSVNIVISVDGNGTVFPLKLKLQGESFE